MKKYKLTRETKEVGGIKLCRIQALRDFNDVKKGDKGGWIEKEENLSQEGDCWVSGDARVYGNAWVSGDARVSGNAWVYDNAWVSDNARVYDNAWVYNNARVYGNAWVSGNARVYGNALVYDNARVYGSAWVYGDARVYQLELIGGYFYHTKDKSETIEKVEQDNDETLCSDPEFGEEEPKGKKVKIRIADGQIVEGEIIEGQQTN
jgi:hypothetical protein